MVLRAKERNMIEARITQITQATTGYGENKRIRGITVVAEYHIDPDIEVEAMEVSLDLPMAESPNYHVGGTLRIEAGTGIDSDSTKWLASMDSDV
jgi:hypothetical protein